MNVWEPVEIPLNQPLSWAIGPWRLWLERTANEWHLATRLAPDESALAAAEPAAKPADLEWRRWMCGDDARTVCLAPVMPDRPTVVRPDGHLRILPGHDALFFVSIPVWARVVAPQAAGARSPGLTGLTSLIGPNAPILLEEPTVILSRTWFGDVSAGELCYALKTRARRQIAAEQVSPHQAICPLRVRNASMESFDFRRLCLRVEHLRIYEGQGCLWTNGVALTFTGQDRSSRANYESGAPAVEGVGAMIADCRSPVAKSVMKTSFEQLKTFVGMGF